MPSLAEEALVGTPLDPAPPREPLCFERRLEGEWTIVSLGPGTCTYRAAHHFARYAFASPPEIVCEPDFHAGRRRAREAGGDTLLLLPCVHEVFAELYASPHWRLLDGYWFHLDNPPLYLGRKPGPAAPPPSTCASIRRLRPLLADPDGNHRFDFVDVETTQEAARRVMDGECGYCVTNVYGVERFGVEVVEELHRMKIGWYSFRYRPRTFRPPGSATGALPTRARAERGGTGA